MWLSVSSPVKHTTDSETLRTQGESTIQLCPRQGSLRIHAVSTAEIVLKQLPTWFAGYNLVHPHRALKYRAPEELRQDQFNPTVCPVWGNSTKVILRDWSVV